MKPRLKRILELTLWLWLMLPVGLWKLWHDASLSVSEKWRILIYLFVLPTLAYVAASIWSANRTLQRLMP